MEKIKYSILLLGELYHKRTFLFQYCITNKMKILFSRMYEKYQVPIVVKGSDMFKEDVKYDEKSDTVIVYSQCLPIHVSIAVNPIDDRDIVIKQENFVSYDKLVFISSWQYEYEPFEAMLRCIPILKLNNPFIEILVVLYKSSINGGATDIGNQDIVIEKVYKKYKKQYDVQIMDSSDTVISIIHPKFHIEDSLSPEYCDKYKVWKEELYDEQYGLIFDYSDIANMITDRYINSSFLEQHIYGLQQIKNSKDLASSYFENFCSQYYHTTEKLIIDFYIDFIKDICVWDIEKDIIFIKKHLKQKLKDMTISNNKDKVCAPKNNMEYNNLELKYGLRIDFYNGITSFYNEYVIHFLQQHLKEKSAKIDVYLSKIIKE